MHTINKIQEWVNTPNADSVLTSLQFQKNMQDFNNVVNKNSELGIMVAEIIRLGNRDFPNIAQFNEVVSLVKSSVECALAAYKKQFPEEREYPTTVDCELTSILPKLREIGYDDSAYYARGQINNIIEQLPKLAFIAEVEAVQHWCQARMKKSVPDNQSFLLSDYQNIYAPNAQNSQRRGFTANVSSGVSSTLRR